MDIQVNRVFSKGDTLVLDAARASFNRTADQYTELQNQRLLKFLASAEPAHWAPFGHARYTISVDDPNLMMLLENPHLRTGLVVRTAKYGSLQFTHSLWGWRNMLQWGVFTGGEAHSILQALNRVEEVKGSLEAMGLSREVTVNDRHIEQTFDDVTLRIRCPIVIARQLFKHQVGFVFSEASGRYIDYTTINRPLAWCNAPDNRKQGAGALVGFMRHCLADLIMGWSHLTSRAAYWLLRKVVRVAPEQARYVMPMATDTTFVVTGHKKAWKRLLEQRLHSGAQQEITYLAEEIETALGVNLT